MAASVTLPFALITILLMRLVLRSRNWKPATGREQLAGATVSVTEPFAPIEGGSIYQGMVRMHGELWRAVAREAIPAGAQARVVAHRRVDRACGAFRETRRRRLTICRTRV